MKKGVLLLLGMFMMVSSVEANSGIKLSKKIGVDYRYEDAVSFVERGIQFHVYLNGDFDFDSRYLRKRRNRVRIFRDHQGRVKRVGNVFINYDYRGNVRKIGRIYIDYHRGRLSQVGNLTIRYNRWGDPRFYGQVRYNDYYYDNNYYNDYAVGINLNIGTVCSYDDPYFYRNEFRNNYRQFREDQNFYYYRAKPNARVSRDKILKRRKLAPGTSKRKAVQRKPNVRNVKRKNLQQRKRENQVIKRKRPEKKVQKKVAKKRRTEKYERRKRS